jgi:geranylgeranyl diphosphate synthase type II
MVGGQVIDLRGEKEKLSLETLKKLHRKKTGALIRCAALLGCLAAGRDFSSRETQAACEYADNIGLAFQIVDDILDATGDEALLGKNIGSDEVSGKTTFLSFYTVDEAHRYAEELTADAISAIEHYEGSEVLVALAHYLLDRNY